MRKKNKTKKIKRKNNIGVLMLVYVLVTRSIYISSAERNLRTKKMKQCSKQW